MSFIESGKKTGKFFLGLGISFLIFLVVFIVLSLMIFSALFWFQGYLSELMISIIFFVITSIVFISINLGLQHLFKDIYIKKGMNVGYKIVLFNVF